MYIQQTLLLQNNYLHQKFKSREYMGGRGAARWGKTPGWEEHVYFKRVQQNVHGTIVYPKSEQTLQFPIPDPKES